MVMSLRSKWAAGKARGGRISQSIRNRRATQPPAHFQRNPPGRGRLAFPPPRRIDPYESRYGRFTASPARTALKNSQLTCGDVTIICETVHKTEKFRLTDQDKSNTVWQRNLSVIYHKVGGVLEAFRLNHHRRDANDGG